MTGITFTYVSTAGMSMLASALPAPRRSPEKTRLCPGPQQTGTIDADYRGEVMVLLVNLSADDFTVNDGERIAQMVIARHETAAFVETDELDATERGAGGYGHTGVE